jgi:hypothetical protein
MDKDTERAFHGKMAVDCFNAVWDYLEEAERTRDEDDAMIHDTIPEVNAATDGAG